MEARGPRTPICSLKWLSEKAQKKWNTKDSFQEKISSLVLPVTLQEQH